MDAGAGFPASGEIAEASFVSCISWTIAGSVTTPGTA
jgi:hypothetical protein